ncbi:hypothetical protein Tco_1327558 [Tanacetum coccineum]
MTLFDDINDDQEKDYNVSSTNNVNTTSDGTSTNNVHVVSSTINAAGIEVNVVGAKTSIELPDDPNMPELEDIVYSDDDDDVGVEADMNNLDAFMPVSPILTTRVHKDHPVEQIIGDLNLAPQTRRMTKNLEEHEPKKVIHALKGPRWIEAIQEELLQFKLQEVWTLVDLPNGKSPIGTKWVYKNKKDERGIVIKNKASQDKYVIEILKKFGFIDVKTASTPMETQKALLKDEDGKEVDVHLYRSMIGSLMYLTSLRPAYSDSDYARASLEKKSITGGCQFLGCRLISWQCKKQNVVANSTTEPEYVAASSCCGQVLWIQNQLLDYGYNFMHTKIYIDNEITIFIVKNHVFHSKTKHIEIRHHFIRYSNEKKQIQIIKIHTDKNVTDLLKKVFDVSRFQYLIASIGMLNL